MMLRNAMALYDLDIVEEAAFMAWREDMSATYPGKVVLPPPSIDHAHPASLAT